VIIKRATIFGFGKWVDYTIDFSTKHPMYIYGENESGKSTLYTFIMFMLFGLPPKQREFYRPKTSGKMGGRLTVSIDGETFIIERLHEVRNGQALCYISDGRQKGESWLKERLKGMTLSTYQSVFSFSAKDLELITEMKEDDLGEVILGIGLTGATNLYAVEKQLDQKLAELYKPTGKKPLINQQLNQLLEINDRLEKWKRLERSYEEKQVQVKKLEEEMNRTRDELKAASNERMMLEKQQHALPLLQEYQGVTKQLNLLPNSILFPEDGIYRWEKLKEKLLPLKSEIAVLQNNNERYQGELKEIEKDLVADTIYQEGKELVGKSDEYDRHTDEASKLSTSIEKQRDELKKSLHELQLPISQQELTTMNLSLFTEKTWKQMKEDMDSLDFEQEQVQIEKNQHRRERNKIIEESKAMQDKLVTDEQLTEWRNQLHEANHTFLLRDAKHKYDKRETEWQMNKRKKQKNAFLFALVTFLIGILMVGIGLAANEKLFLVAALLITFLGIGQWRWQKQTITDMDLYFRQAVETRSGLQLSEADRVRIDHNIQQQEQYRTQIAALKERLKTLDIDALKWEEKQVHLLEKMRQMDERIMSEQERYPFLTHVAPAYWPDLFHRLKTFQHMNKKILEDEFIYDKIRKTLEKMHANVVMFFHKVDREMTSTSVSEQISWLQDMIKKHEAAKNKLVHYQANIDENNRVLQQAKLKMQPLEEEMKQLLQIAKVDGEEAFYEQGKKKQHQLFLKEKAHTLTEQLASLFPDGSLLMNMEQVPTPFILNQKLEDLRAEIVKLEDCLEKKRQALAAVQAELATMEEREDLSETAHQMEMQKEVFNRLAKRWATIKTAKEILQQAKRTYQQKYLTKVIECTSDFFQKITIGAYRKVFSPLEDRPFIVEAADGTHYHVKELSQGTIDQLYVALRLAVSVCISEKHALPFIIDDAFVHFDSVRTERITSLLYEIAKDHQIIVFTCKKDVIEAVKNRNYVQILNSIRIH
jgi:uncharacterized protein YhaN